MTNRFQRNLGASGCYTCGACQKSTRETGQGESSCKLCAFCYLEGGEENSLSDGNCTEAEFVAYMLKLEKRYNRVSRHPVMVAYHKANPS